MTGKDRIFALKGSLRIPGKKIRSVEVLPRKEVPPGRGILLRLPGTYFPGVVPHGSYGLGANREFWALSRPDEVLMVTVDDWSTGGWCLEQRIQRSTQWGSTGSSDWLFQLCHGATTPPATDLTRWLIEFSVSEAA
ncbi:hypothetical protein BH23ACT4_BH23ACT4_00850 [soil metagenome]